MKKVFLCSLLLAAGLPAVAQIEKGNVLLGGSVSGSWSRTQSNQSNVFPWSYLEGNLSPNVGYFVAKGLAVGAVTGFGISRRRSQGVMALPDGTQLDPAVRSHNFTLGPALHYFVMLGEKVALYAHTSLAWGRSSTTSSGFLSGTGTAATNTFTGRSRTLAVGPGVAYFLNPHVALLGSLSFRNHRSRQDGDQLTFATTETNNGVYLNVGVQVFLGRGQ